jgi:hypothetical protein
MPFSTPLLAVRTGSYAGPRMLVEPLLWTDDDCEETLIIPEGYKSDGYSLPPRNLTIAFFLALGFLLGTLLGWLVFGGTADETVVMGIVSGLALGLLAAWVLGDPWGLGAEAAVLHDYLCGNEVYDSRKNDRIFKREMRLCGVGFVRRAVYFRCVRVFKPLYRRWL